MASVNKVILVGNLGRDPEVRFMPNGEAVCNFSIATTDSWRDKNGQKQERTEWHNIVMYRKLAEIAGEYLKKGRPVYVEGACKHANGKLKKAKTATPQKSWLTKCKCWADVKVAVVQATKPWMKIKACNHAQSKAQHHQRRQHRNQRVAQILMPLKTIFRFNLEL